MNKLKIRKVSEGIYYILWSLCLTFQSKKMLALAKDDFETQNSQLSEDLPKLYESRIDYFQPCLEALIKAQVTFY